METAGVVIGALPLLVSVIQGYSVPTEANHILFTTSGPFRKTVKGHGYVVAWLLRLIFNEALPVMERVEETGVHATDREVKDFMKLHGQSVNMIGVAVSSRRPEYYVYWKWQRELSKLR